MTYDAQDVEMVVEKASKMLQGHGWNHAAARAQAELFARMGGKIRRPFWLAVVDAIEIHRQDTAATGAR